MLRERVAQVRSSLRTKVNFSLTDTQIRSARQSYVNALLIASRGTRYPAACAHSTVGTFGGPVVRVAGFCAGACASCEWKSHRQQCPCLNNEEAFVPAAVPRQPPPGLHLLTL